ncbi:hypothetical protein M885DRAFT_567404 [Pelagophyceae sp. CCMP2097]|nr:hypothetical protein M885DRAFT_567404 [Pelagophyceae sp. CCMP2097]
MISKQTRDLLGLVLDDPVILSLAPRLGTIDANTDAVRIVESLKAYVIERQLGPRGGAYVDATRRQLETIAIATCAAGLSQTALRHQSSR